MTVYAIQAGERGPIKIGWSENVERRLGNLQTGNSSVLRVLGEIAVGPEHEAAIHALFDQHRINGEWFSPAPAIKELFSTPAGDVHAELSRRYRSMGAACYEHADEIDRFRQWRESRGLAAERALTHA